jgi:hypothetical protein
VAHAILDFQLQRFNSWRIGLICQHSSAPRIQVLPTCPGLRDAANCIDQAKDLLCGERHVLKGFSRGLSLFQESESLGHVDSAFSWGV